MADPQTTRLLDFTTKEERQPVRIDGITYQMRLGSDMTFAERQRVATLASQLAEPLMAIERGVTLPKARQKVVKKLLLAACSEAITAPTSVIAKLDQLDQIVLAVTFFERSLSRLQTVGALLRAPAPRPAEPPPPGIKSSRASLASTAARRGSGRRAARSAS